MRQIVVLNVAIVGWPDGRSAPQPAGAARPLPGRRGGCLARYAAHVDHLGPDGVVAFFGVPHSHEDDAERALHVAFGLRAAAHSSGIELAAGIKIGPALVSLACKRTATCRRKEYSAPCWGRRRSSSAQRQRARSWWIA